MNLRHPRAVTVAAVLGVAMLAACGNAGDTEKSPTSTPGSSVVTTPTDKGRPGGPNQFSPTPVAPLTPPGGAGTDGTAQH